jgi:aspartyl-tRNA(Asn)/glutamyl-tRNA(Gln) amidotransferase subunit A
LWPTDGVFPLAPQLDSIGLLTRSADDAALIFAALESVDRPGTLSLKGLRLGRPQSYFFESLGPEVEVCTSNALAALEKAGVEVVPIEVPEAAERELYFPTCLPAELLASLGRDRFQAGRNLMDPVIAKRTASALGMQADTFIRMERRRIELCQIAAERMASLDGWVSPTTALVAPPIEQLEEPEISMKLALSITQNTQPGNLFGQCGISIPIHHFGSQLPVGLQVMCAAGRDTHALSIACAIEAHLGIPPRPDLTRFLS